MGVTGGSAAVIVGSLRRGIWSTRHTSIVAGIAQAPVADPSCGHHPALSRGTGDRCSAGKTAHGGSVGELVRVIVKLAEHPSAKDWPSPGKLVMMGASACSNTVAS